MPLTSADDAFADAISAPRLPLIETASKHLLAERDAPQTLAALCDARAGATREPLPTFVPELMLARAGDTDRNGRSWPAFYVVLRASGNGEARFAKERVAQPPG